MTTAEIKKTTETKMDQTIAAFTHNLTKIRTGRANPALLDTIHVDYYGSMVPLSQVANLSLIDSRTISVQPWEKGMGAKIEKAIRESELGLNPASMGDLIRVPMPPMTNTPPSRDGQDPHDYVIENSPAIRKQISDWIRAGGQLNEAAPRILGDGCGVGTFCKLPDSIWDGTFPG